MSMLKPKMSEDHCGVKGINNESRRRPATVGSEHQMKFDHHSLTWTIGSRAKNSRFTNYPLQRRQLMSIYVPDDADIYLLIKEHVYVQVYI